MIICICGDLLISGGCVRVIYDREEFYGRIKILEPTAVHIKFKKDFVNNYEYTALAIEFQFNRLLFVRQHIAVDHVSSAIGAHFIQPNEIIVKAPQLNVHFDDKTNATLDGNELEWHNKQLNKYQRYAVVNIMQGRARPMPYIIFGPPGNYILILIYKNRNQLGI